MIKKNLKRKIIRKKSSAIPLATLLASTDEPDVAVLREPRANRLRHERLHRTDRLLVSPVLLQLRIRRKNSPTGTQSYNNIQRKILLYAGIWPITEL